ncbi:aldo/keto reductase [Tabrizicola sp. J26]|uniref:aldo/keto reductase n=1 Tax=Alitabrizicola rongguiensis TaxID=2909234 RepID=UPI001F1AC849|nr:aldo/keto reductase [Tabrizicola rongguiensis]MCF1709184.1 aldo/keto reductase [Tabrizicola rongguiensis]
MRKRRLGAGGPEVSAIGLGCMSFGGIFGPTTEAESFACLDAALDHGIDFLDTANIYGSGVSETVMGRWLASRKPQVVIATKASIVRGGGFDNSEAHLRAELEGSLKRLGVDRVELFYIHRREQARPIEEVVETLKSLIKEGKIGGYGLSEISPTTLRRAHAVHPCMAVQNEYSLWTRLPELGLIRTCAELSVAFVPFSPLARGALGTPMADPAAFAKDDFRATIPRFHDPNWSENRKRIAAFSTFCAARGWSVPAAALAWILDRGDHLIPIPGTRTADHLAAWAGADRIRLTESDRIEIDRLLPVGWAHGDRYGDDQAANVERYC